MLNKEKAFTKNIIISISVQITSLLVSFLLGLIVPKYLEEYQYANWQIFLLYLNYVGVLHFGLLDGLVLRYSQYNYEELDKPRIRSQYKLLLVSTGSIAFVCIVAALFFTSGITCKTIIFIAIGIVTKNLITYNSYTFQITNRISQYALLIISQRIGYGLLVVIFLVLRINHFEWYCIADLAGDLIGIIVARFFNKGMYFGKSLPLHQALLEWKVNISSGMILMLANCSSMLLVGSAKMIIQWHWDKLTFGKMSFAFSLTNLFLTFVTAISIVLFPQLKRMDQNKLPKLYRSIRNLISPILFIVMLAYFPGCWILEHYLPAYRVSLAYVGILLPIIVYTSKISLLTNNYLKVYRKEKQMLFANILSVVIAWIVFVVNAYVFNNLNGVLIGVVLSVALRSILSEIIVMRTIHDWFINEFFIETVMTAMFILYTNLMSRWSACIAYTLTLIVYFFYQRKNGGILNFDENNMDK